HIPYAYENPKEFIAVAAEGDMSKYSPEFKKLLVAMGMPEWQLNLKSIDNAVDTPKASPKKVETPKTEIKADIPAPASVKPMLDPAEIKRQNLKAEQDKLAELRANYPVARETMTINGEKRLVNIFQGSRSGSSAGYWIQDVKTGELSYIKYPPKGKNFTNRSIEEQLYGQAAQAKTEALSTDLYRAAGLPSPEIEIVRDANGNVGIKSKFLGKLDNPTIDDVAAVREGFAVDCWLANWDALKTGNVQMQAGQAIRADVGGSLNYRARGARKGTAFGENVNELTSFFNPKNSWSLPYIKNMTKEELINSLKRVTTIDDATIASIIKKAEANGISNPNFLREMLIERRNYMERFQKLCETTPQLPNESIADYVQRIQDATPKTTYNIGGKSFDDIPISARIYGDLNDLDASDLERINKSVKMSELYTPSQKRIFEASYQALENSKGAKIKHNTNNVLTENNLLHVTDPDSLDGILNGGLVSREYSGRVAARRSDGDPGSMTPMCADVWEVQNNYTIGEYFTRPHSQWNKGEKNFLPNDPTDYGIVLVFDKSSIDKTLLDNSFKVSDKTSPLYQDGNMGGYDSYTSHRAVPVGLPSNAIDRILLSPEHYGAAKIDEIYAQIQKSGLDIDIYDLHGNLLRGKGSADAAKPNAPTPAKADTPAPKQEPEVHYPTPEERMQLSQIGQNINRAKSADDLAKAQSWLDKMPDCSQKEHLQRQLNEKKSF
ncbi:hypothetical protein J6A31_08230, partial [bacterium]|nr:hypothetical protein [bacterium]